MPVSLPRPETRRVRRSVRWALRRDRCRTWLTWTVALAVAVGLPLLLVDDAEYQLAVQQAGPVVVAAVVEVEQTRGGPLVDVRTGGRRAEVYDTQGTEPRVGALLRVVVDPDDPTTVVLADVRPDPHRALVEGLVGGAAAALLLLAAGLAVGRAPRPAVRAVRTALRGSGVVVRRGSVVHARQDAHRRGRGYALVHAGQGERFVEAVVALEDGDTVPGWWRAVDDELRPGRPVLVVGDPESGWVLLSTTTCGPCWPHAPLAPSAAV